jgi:hypothetical protein
MTSVRIVVIVNSNIVMKDSTGKQTWTGPWGVLRLRGSVKNTCSSRHQIACFKATEGLNPSYRTAIRHQYSVASFAGLRVASCFNSPGGPLIMLQRCTIFLRPWSMQFGDGYCNRAVLMFYILKRVQFECFIVLTDFYFTRLFVCPWWAQQTSK